jgi:WD40 repeat protein
MSERPSDKPGAPDTDIARRFDAIRRRFQADWLAGKKPAIDDYLAKFSESVRLELLAELVALERELKEKRQRPTARRSAIAESPTVAPAAPVTAKVPRQAIASDQAPAPLPPRAETTVELGQSAGPAAPIPSRRLGDYEIIREIARGGMGVVFQARQISLNRMVALKMILAGQLADQTDVKRFYTEAEATANLDHPAIVPIYEVNQHEGHHYFSMGFVEGESLSHRLKKGPLAARQAAALMATVAEAIDYAHQRGVIHRDLKPGNILLDRKGIPRVTDFGLAKRIEADSALTGSGQIMGTPSYMPPEQAGGKRGAVGPAADVYALGATLYCAITGRPPFQAATAMDTVLQVLNDEPVPPRRLNPSVPRDLETICLKCLEKEPDERYAGAAALAAELRRFLTGEPIAARPVTWPERAAKWARRKPTLAAAYTLGLLALLLGGLGGAAVWQWRAAARARDGEKQARSIAERARDAAKSAKSEAERQRDRADAARKEADTARVAEEKARAEAERQRERFERFEYGRAIRAAHEEWRQGNVAASLGLLEDTRADLRGWEWRYVHRLCHSDLLTLKANSTVNSASFSPNGSRIVTGNDHTAKVWDAKSGAEILTLKGHTAEVWSASFSPDGSRIVTGSQDTTAKIWDAKSGAEVLTLKGHTGSVTSASFSPDASRIVTGSEDFTAKVWDAKSGAEVLTLKGGWVDSASFRGNGSRVVTWSRAGPIKVWNAEPLNKTINPELERRTIVLNGHSAHVNRLVYTPDGRKLATASDDQTVRLWDISTRRGRAVLRGHSSKVVSLAITPDGAMLASGSGDREKPEQPGELKLWDIASGTSVADLRGHAGPISCLGFSPDGQMLASGSADGLVKLWDVVKRSQLATLDFGDRCWVSGAVFTPDGKTLVTARLATVRLWDVATKQKVADLKGHSDRINNLAISPDGKTLATASRDGTAKLWDLLTLRPRATIPGSGGWVTDLCCFPDGKHLAIGAFSGSVKLWDMAASRQLALLPGSAVPESVAVSPGGTTLAAALGSSVVLRRIAD